MPHPGGASRPAASVALPPALGQAVGVAPAVVFVVGLLVVPSGALLLRSFAEFDPVTRSSRGITLGNYAAVVLNPVHLEVLLNTLRLAGIVTLTCLVLGYPIAYFMARSRSRSATLCAGLVVAPLFVSVVIRAFGWMVLLARQGPVNDALVATGVLVERRQFLYTELAVVIGLVHILCPFMILPVASVLRGIDPALEEAARNLGAGRLGVLRWVIVPLSMPGVMAGVLLVYSHAIAAFVLPAMLGSIRTKLMATMLYEQVLVVGNVPLGGALAAVLVAVTFFLFWLVYRCFGIRAW